MSLKSEWMGKKSGKNGKSREKRAINGKKIWKMGGKESGKKWEKWGKKEP